MEAHGFPRATADLVIFIRPDFENAKKVYKALADFGAPMDSVNIEDFKKPGTIFQIGVIPRRIDIINEIDGVSYEEADRDKIIVDIDGLSVPIISKTKLIINKKASGREKDRLDAIRLENSQSYQLSFN